MLMATSGMREGEALMIRVKDVDFSSKPARVLIPASITKTSRGRETYVTDEAVEIIRAWMNHERLGPDCRLLDCGDNVYMAEKRVIRMFRAVMNHFPEMNLNVDENHRVHKIHLYSFRKFFYSKTMPVIGEERAHALMGHGSLYANVSEDICKSCLQMELNFRDIMFQFNRLFSWTVVRRELSLDDPKLHQEMVVRDFIPLDFKLEETTLWRFPKSGKWGIHNGVYPGNWAPQVPRNLILRYSRVGETVCERSCNTHHRIVFSIPLTSARHSDRQSP